MPQRKTSSGHGEDRLRSFGAALGAALLARGWTQRDLADSLGLTQSAISAWKAGQAEPAPVTVFRIERALGLSDGTLSSCLGFVPARPASQKDGVLKAIMEDPRLDERGRRVLRAAYRELTQGT